jgi:hypothetical protein
VEPVVVIGIAELLDADRHALAPGSGLGPICAEQPISPGQIK